MRVETLFRFTINENHLSDVGILYFYRKKVNELDLARKSN